MGDVLTLIEKAEQAVEQDEQEEMERRLLAGQFTFDDFLASTRMLKKMGPLQGVMKLVPGMGRQLEGMEVDDCADGADRGDRALDDAARAAGAARHQRAAAAADRGRERHDDRGRQPPPSGPQADGEDDEGDGEGEAPDPAAGAHRRRRRARTKRGRR